MRKRVVVTGIGCVTPLGTDTDTLWDNLIHGRSSVRKITLFDATNFPTQIASEVHGWSPANCGLDPEEWNGRGRHTRFAVGAAKQAVDDSGILNHVAPERLGVYLGCGEGHQDFMTFTNMMVAALTEDGLDMDSFIRAGLAQLDPMEELEQEPNMPPAYVAAMFDAQGPNANCLTACAASSQAIGEAVEILRDGDADAMIAGGSHSMIHPFGVTGFNLLTALSIRNDEPERASRPFDLHRDGFVIGEGGSMIVLEELEHAKARGANIYGEILGYGTTADAFRITDTHPEGRGAIRCIQMALADAGVNTDQIDYINAHGTSTSVNDKVESLAIRHVFGAGADTVPVSSTKSMMGHLIAAAGATELIICLLTLRNGILPPTINYETPDPDCDLDYIPNRAREKNCRIALNNSFGFGGQNICLVVGKYTH
ncbi:MAG: beta-ketoacyl-[acyl-carrier-protein] synthase family protein [Pirellulales bacterium]|nr:beta-ketoacyl-[acyl-carrier-protein] synthase family protein [Pirellulales bacterium]